MKAEFGINPKAVLGADGLRIGSTARHLSAGDNNLYVKHNTTIDVDGDTVMAGATRLCKYEHE